MAKHTPGFLKLVQDAKTRIREIDIHEAKRRMNAGGPVTIVDVREESEYAADHLPGAVHLGKGVIERDIESQFPDPNTVLILYCGGGYRSALAADALGKMGYVNILSMDGGIREWREAGLPLEKN